MRSVPTKIAGNTYTSDEFNTLPSQELQNSVLTSGQILDAGDLNQLGKAMSIYGSAGDFYTDGGAVNSYVLTPIGTPARQAPPAYVDGVRVRFVAGNTNTGISTINLNSLGVKSLKENGGDVAAGRIKAGSVIEATYLSSPDQFELISVSAADFIPVINIAELESINTDNLVNNQRTFVGGYFEIGDAGGGELFLDATSTETANGGTIIIPTFVGFSGIGRWKRIVDGEINVKMFGAKGDNVTDDTVVLQATLDYVSSLFTDIGFGGGGGIVLIPAGKYIYTGLTVPKGVSLIGEGQGHTNLLLNGLTATGLKSAAATSELVADQVSFGRFQGFSMISNETAPISQVMWDLTGFTRWLIEDVFFEWFGGCTGVRFINITPAASGGPAQWYNTFLHCFFLNGASRPVGGIALELGDPSNTKEQITALTMIGGRISAALITGTGLAIRGTGNSFTGVTFEGLAVACDMGSTGTRGSESNSFFGCFWESNTINRRMRANANQTTFFGSFLTGGVDDDQGTVTIIEDGGQFKSFAGNVGGQSWEVFVNNADSRRPKFIGLINDASVDFENSAGTEFTINNAAAFSSGTAFFRILRSNITQTLLALGTTQLTCGTDATVNLGSASVRFNTVFASVGTINTSDERHKTQLQDLDATEKLVAQELKTALKKFQLKDSVTEKGVDGARIHVGIGAQTVRDIFVNHGLDPHRYGLFCYDKWEDEIEIHDAVLDEEGNILEPEYKQEWIKAGNIFGIRYDELLSFIIAGL